MKTATTNEVLATSADQGQPDRGRFGNSVEQGTKHDPSRSSRVAATAAVEPRARAQVDGAPPASPSAVASAPASPNASFVRSKEMALIKTPAPKAITKATARSGSDSCGTSTIAAPRTRARPPTSPRKQPPARPECDQSAGSTSTARVGVLVNRFKEKVMTETIKQAKLVQYLNEAYAKEKELEAALEADISVTTGASPTRSGCTRTSRRRARMRAARAPDQEARRRRRHSSARGRSHRVGKADAGKGGAREGPAARRPRNRRGRDAAQERQDPVLQRARGDRHLHRDRDARREPSATPTPRSWPGRSAATRSGWRSTWQPRSRC